MALLLNNKVTALLNGAINNSQTTITLDTVQNMNGGTVAIPNPASGDYSLLVTDETHFEIIGLSGAALSGSNLTGVTRGEDSVGPYAFADNSRVYLFWVSARILAVLVAATASAQSLAAEAIDSAETAQSLANGAQNAAEVAQDTADAKVNKTGDTFTGDVDMDNNDLNNVDEIYAATIRGNRNGVAAVLGSVTSGALTDEDDILVVEAPDAGLYEISAYMYVSAISVDVIEMRVSYIQPGVGPTTVTIGPAVSTTGAKIFPTTLIESGASDITVATVLTTGIGSIAYTASAVIKRVKAAA